MQIMFNQEPVELTAPLSLQDFLSQHGIQAAGTACAVNEEIVPKSQWSDFMLAEGMKLDVFSLVAGG